MTEEGLKKKWQKLRRRARLFNYIPFIDFVMVAGSMAMGTAKETSDFDVIVGVKSGRIFTARFLCVLLSDALGIRAKSHDNFYNKADSADKICFNHFVTAESYKLSPPYDDYWKKLYESLVPLAGDKGAIKKFFESNDWVDQSQVKNKHESVGVIKNTLPKVVLGSVLSGRLGDYIEKRLKNYQIKRISGGLGDANHYKPRIIYSDSELEFHPNTKRIEDYLSK